METYEWCIVLIKCDIPCLPRPFRWQQVAAIRNAIAKQKKLSFRAVVNLMEWIKSNESDAEVVSELFVRLFFLFWSRRFVGGGKRGKCYCRSECILKIICFSHSLCCCCCCWKGKQRKCGRIYGWKIFHMQFNVFRKNEKYFHFFPSIPSSFKQEEDEEAEAEEP